MSSRRYAKQRDLNEPAIVEALRDIPGCKVERLDWPCDLVAGYQSKNIFLEVKPIGRENRADQKDQAEWRKGWSGQIRVVTTPEQAVDCVLRIGKNNGGQG